MRTGRRRERGTATAELAVALPSLVLVLAVALAAVDLGLAQVRCVDAARLGARLLARGEPQGRRWARCERGPGRCRGLGDDHRGRVTVSVTGQVPAALGPWVRSPAPAASAQALLEAAP